MESLTGFKNVVDVIIYQKQMIDKCNGFIHNLEEKIDYLYDISRVKLTEKNTINNFNIHITIEDLDSKDGYSYYNEAAPGMIDKYIDILKNRLNENIEIRNKHIKDLESYKESLLD